MRPPLRWLPRIRLAIVALALLATGWIVSRFEVLRLPDEACSPLLRFSAGAVLFVDGRPPSYGVGDAVFFTDATGALRLARIDARVEEGSSRWILVTDNAACPSPASGELGPIDEAAMRGRVLFALAGDGP